jgi:D-glycero-D-manno-heptose 1,7-bisphosphate phosphatase
MISQAVFLDRDGVINRVTVRGGRPYPPGDLSQLKILPGVPDAMRELKVAGFDLIVVTNQPDVARGTTSREQVESINARLMDQLPLDEVLTCFHDDADACNCRKPRPGFMLEMWDKWGIDLARSFLVGDCWRDVEAGRNAGCRTVLIDCGYDEHRPSGQADYVCGSLSEAARWITSHS